MLQSLRRNAAPESCAQIASEISGKNTPLSQTVAILSQVDQHNSKRAGRTQGCLFLSIHLEQYNAVAAITDGLNATML